MFLKHFHVFSDSSPVSPTIFFLVFPVDLPVNCFRAVDVLSLQLRRHSLVYITLVSVLADRPEAFRPGATSLVRLRL